MAGPKSKHPAVERPRTLNMEDAREFEKFAKEWERKACRTKGTARAKLRELGIIRKDGSLTKKYRING